MLNTSQQAAARPARRTEAEVGERLGMPRVILGVFFVTMGMAWLLSLCLQASGSDALTFFRYMALGLAGQGSFLLPPISIWLGALLCVSARRRVSPGTCLLALLTLICALSLCTLIPVVQGVGSLMEYMQTLNVRRNLAETSTLRAYIYCAYYMYQIYRPVGGGVLGMLLAYPLWSFAGVTGAIVLSALLMITSLIAMLRLPVRNLLRSASDRAEERRLKQEQEMARHLAEEEAKKREWEQPLPDMPPAQIVAPPQQVVYEQPVQAPQPQPQAPRRHTHRREDGFVKVSPGILQEEYFPETQSEHEAEPLPMREQEPPVYEPEPTVYSEPEPAAYSEPEPEDVPEPPKVTKAAPPSSGPARKPVRADYERRMDGTPAPEAKQLSMPMPSDYQRPAMDILNMPPPVDRQDNAQEDKRRARLIETTLASFGITAETRHVVHGPAITQFALRLAEGIKVGRVGSFIDNIAMELEARGSVRAETPIPGTSLVGIEVPNEKTTMVTLREVLDSPEMRANTSPTLVALGKDITGKPVTCDLSAMPHLLIAGATGSGKSVCINCIITSILYHATPDQVRMIMIDPKTVELQPYNGIPHLLSPVVTEPKKAALALDWAVQEMMDRYQKMRKLNARNITRYNSIVGVDEKQLPSIVVIIDELSDLMLTCKKAVEDSISRLAALARAAGIYLVIATQRPSVNVITGVIKANIPSRIAFAVASNTDSRVIIDANGAEKLLGKGDMLFAPNTSSERLRVQGCFVSDAEIVGVTDYVRGRNQPAYDMDFLEHMESDEPEMADMDDEADPEAGEGGEFDALLSQAVDMAIESGQMSISMLQRRLRVGYARSGRIIDEMTRRGIISPSEGSKPRRTLISREEYMKMPH